MTYGDNQPDNNDIEDELFKLERWSSKYLHVGESLAAIALLWWLMTIYLIVSKTGYLPLYAIDVGYPLLYFLSILLIIFGIVLSYYGGWYLSFARALSKHMNIYTDVFRSLGDVTIYDFKKSFGGYRMVMDTTKHHPGTYVLVYVKAGKGLQSYFVVKTATPKSLEDIILIPEMKEEVKGFKIDTEFFMDNGYWLYAPIPEKDEMDAGTFVKIIKTLSNISELAWVGMDVNKAREMMGGTRESTVSTAEGATETMHTDPFEQVILGLINDNPGADIMWMSRVMDLRVENLQMHLTTLLRSGKITSAEDEYGQLRYFIPGTEPRDARKTPQASRGVSDEQKRKMDEERLKEEVRRLQRELELKKESKKDPYGILGVKKAAQKDEVREAYRKLTKTWHPDKFVKYNDPQVEEMAHARYLEINKAYEEITKERGW